MFTRKRQKGATNPGNAMPDDSFHSVLRRKAGAGRARLRIARLTPERAMVQALSKAAQDLMNLPLGVEENAAALLSLAELPEHLPDRPLLALLSGPRDDLGLMALDPDLMAGLIEVQMLGRIGAAPVQPRRPTRTDAAMCSPFIDRFLRLLEAELGGSAAEDNWAAGYRYASALDDPRPLGLLLEDQPYRCFRLKVKIGQEATRSGNLFLALPGNGVLAGAAAGADPAEVLRWETSLSRTLSEAPASLGTILYRLVLPLGQAVALAPGVELALPCSALDGVELTDGSGRVLARARLGQSEGQRALRLLTPDQAGIAGQGAASAAEPAMAFRAATAIPDAAPQPEAPRSNAGGRDRGSDPAADAGADVQAVGF